MNSELVKLHLGMKNKRILVFPPLRIAESSVSLRFLRSVKISLCLFYPALGLH